MVMEAHGILDIVSLSSAVRGFHIYQEIWTPKLGEILTTERDTTARCVRWSQWHVQTPPQGPMARLDQ